MRLISSCKIVLILIVSMMMPGIALASLKLSPAYQPDIQLPIATYWSKTDQGLVSRSPSGNSIVYWANDSLNKIPAAHSIGLDGRDVAYVRWNRSGNLMIIGSPADTNNGRGWAWIVDMRKFVVLRKLAGNVVAAWFDRYQIAYMYNTKIGSVYVHGTSRKMLSRSIYVVGSSDDGIYLLTRHYRKIHIGDLEVYRRLEFNISRIAVVQSNVDFDEESSAQIVSDQGGDCLVTISANGANISTLCTAYVVSGRDHKCRSMDPGTEHKIWFNLSAFTMPSGFCGICRTINEPAAHDLKTNEYQYVCKNGNLYLRNVSNNVLAYSHADTGATVSLLTRGKYTFIHIGGT